MGATVEIKPGELARALRLAGDKAPAKIARVMRRSATSVRAAMVTGVRKDLGTSAKAVRDRIEIKVAGGLDPSAKLIVNAKRLGLRAFGAVQLKRAGVRAKIGGRPKTYPGAFIPGRLAGTSSRFSVQVFRRTGSRRLPIVALKGPSVAHVFGKYWQTIGRAKFREVLPVNLRHELKLGGLR